MKILSGQIKTNFFPRRCYYKRYAKRYTRSQTKYLPGKNDELNKQNIFDMVAKGISHGYENSTFKYEVKVLKKLAKKWGVSPKLFHLKNN